MSMREDCHLVVEISTMAQISCLTLMLLIYHPQISCTNLRPGHSLQGLKVILPPLRIKWWRIGLVPSESRGTCVHDEDGVCFLHGPGAVLGFKPVRIATPGPNGKKMTRKYCYTVT